MEIIIKPTFQHMIWKIKRFLELEADYVDSPEFFFDGDTYCLRLFPRMKITHGESTVVHALRKSFTFADRKAFCKISSVYRDENGVEIYKYANMSLEENRYFERSVIENNRDNVVQGQLHHKLLHVAEWREKSRKFHSRG